MPTPLKTRVLLADDHTVVRSGLRMVLDAQPDIQVVAEAGDGAEAVQKALSPDVDLAILDVAMPRMTGLQAVAELHRRRPDLRLLILSMYDDERYFFEALKAGASGYVLKDAAFTELLAGIHSVMEGRRYLSPPLTELVMEDYVRRASGQSTGTELDKLSAREREILQLVAEGRSSAQVANMVHISVRTVDTHRYNVMQKLGIHSIAGLTKFAIAHGLTSLR